MDVDESESSLKEKRQIEADAAEQIALAAAGSYKTGYSVPASSASNSTTTSTAGSNRRPFIVPTVLLEDGIKEVPRRFEQCEVEELITLIG